MSSSPRWSSGSRSSIGSLRSATRRQWTGFPATGPPDATVIIVEFSDFQCPFCARFLPTLERAKTEYAGKLRVVYRHLPPSSIHPYAQKAAEASLCAADQGKFRALHDLMFAEQQALEVPDLKEKARRLGLDAAEFDRCPDQGRHEGAVRRDFLAGEALGITGTPALFINGRSLPGAVPFEHLAKLIDDELAHPARASRPPTRLLLRRTPARPEQVE